MSESVETVRAFITGEPLFPYMSLLPEYCKVCATSIIPPQKFGKVIVDKWPVYVCESCVKELTNALVGKKCR